MSEWRTFPPLRNASRGEAAGWPSLKQAMAEGKVRKMNEVEAVARALADCRLWPGAWGQANDVEREAWLFEARAAIAALDECRNREELRAAAAAANAAWDKVGVTEHPSVQFRRGREAGLREAAAVAAALPVPQDNARISYWTGYVDGTEEARDAILALIDAKERVSANE